MKVRRNLPDIRVIRIEKLKLDNKGKQLLEDARDFIRAIKAESADRGILYHSGNAGDYLDSLIALLEAKGAFNEEN